MFRRPTKPAVSVNGTKPFRRTAAHSSNLLNLGPADRLAALGQLASGLAHELNTPLATIAAHAEETLDLLQHGDGALTADAIADLRRRQHAILRQAYRSSEIASKLLQIAQPRRAVCKRCNLESVVDDVILLFEPAARQRRVKLKCAIATGIPQLSISAGDLEQLLVNLVQNALDACDGAGHVCIEASPARGRAKLVISDSGRGIPRWAMDRIFDPFFTTKPVGHGTGLGLCVCHGIVQSVGGTLEVTSSELRGTRATVTLPFAAPAPHPSQPANQHRAADFPARS